MKTILVTGGREWDNRKVVWYALNKERGTHLIHGDCRGLDRQAGDVAQELGMHVTSLPADWRRYRGGAGPIRNRKMLDMEPDIVLAFHDNLRLSKGTKECVNEAVRRGIPVVWYDNTGFARKVDMTFP